VVQRAGRDGAGALALFLGDRSIVKPLPLVSSTVRRLADGVWDLERSASFRTFALPRRRRVSFRLLICRLDRPLFAGRIPPV
jgi:hypothetical protein